MKVVIKEKMSVKKVTFLSEWDDDDWDDDVVPTRRSYHSSKMIEHENMLRVDKAMSEVQLKGKSESEMKGKPITEKPKRLGRAYYIEKYREINRQKMKENVTASQMQQVKEFMLSLVRQSAHG